MDDFEECGGSGKYKDYLLRLLNRNLYSEKEIADRLKAKKCPEEIARRLIGELKEKSGSTMTATGLFSGKNMKARTGESIRSFGE